MTFKYGDIVRARANYNKLNGRWDVDIIARYIERTTSGDAHKILFLKDTPGLPHMASTDCIYSSGETTLYFTMHDNVVSYFESEEIQKTFGDIINDI